MRRNRLYALAGVLSAVVVAGPAIAATVHSHAASGKAAAKAGRRGPRGRRGARGATGPAGVAGPAGTTGAAFLRTIVVSPIDATAVANGALLAAAVAAINGAGASGPELVWIEPGAYDLGTTPLTIPSHVDVEGSGQDVTTIEGEGLLTLAGGERHRDPRAHGHRHEPGRCGRGDRHERRPGRCDGDGQRHDRGDRGAGKRPDDAAPRRHRVGDDVGAVQLRPRARHAEHGVGRRRQLQRLRRRVARARRRRCSPRRRPW